MKGEKLYIYNKSKKYILIYIFFINILEKISYLAKKKNKTFPEKIEKILLVSPAHIGDTIISTICFLPLKENYKDSKIDVLCGSWGKNTYDNSKYINNIYVLDHFFLNRKKVNFFIKLKKFVVQYIKAIFFLRKNQYDLVIFLKSGIKGNLGSLIVGLNSKFYVGFEGMGFEKLLDVKTKFDFNIHEKDNFLKLLKSIPKFELQEKKYMYKVPFIKDEILEVYCKKNMQEAKERILINYEGGDIKRILSKEKVVEIIKKVSKNTNKIYLIATRNNNDKNFQILEQLKKIGINNIEVLPQVDNIFKLGYFLQRIDKVITVDTAITHLASFYVDDITVLYYNDFGYINNPKRFYPNCKNYKNIVSKTENIDDIEFTI